MTTLDAVQLDFSPSSLVLLNFILGLVMFGVALDLKVDDFKDAARRPRATIIGVVAQFLLLPAATFLLIQVIRPAPSVALGMMLVAACPGGNMSNFITHLAGGNTALSIGMTAISTTAAMVMTPLNVTFWAGLDSETSVLLQQIEVPIGSMLLTVMTILGVPLLVGMTLAAKKPTWAAKLRKPLRIFSLVVFGAFIIGALAKNYDAFLTHVGGIAGVVALHNAAALALGYFAARAFRLPDRDARAVSVEVGIQNSGLGLTLIFTFFGGLGGMAVIAAWWGVWHLIAGLTLATFFSWKDRRNPVETSTTV